MGRNAHGGRSSEIPSIAKVVEEKEKAAEDGERSR